MYDQELLNNIRKLQFYCIDLNLYLDNFPDNEEATKDLQAVSHKLGILVRQYEEKYGPLTNFGSASAESPMCWTSLPWPWENY